MDEYVNVLFHMVIRLPFFHNKIIFLRVSICIMLPNLIFSVVNLKQKHFVKSFQKATFLYPPDFHSFSTVNFSACTILVSFVLSDNKC